MPLVMEIPSRELFDEAASKFYITPRTVLHLEHSLLSVSKWESKWKKPYLAQPVLTEEANRKSREEEIDYIRCMTIGDKAVDPNVYLTLTPEEIKKIFDYANDQKTATKVTMQKKGPPSRRIITSELIYYWMAALQIPFRPCETWHLSRLMKLIEVGSAENEAPRSMSKSTALSRSHSINSARRAAHRRKH